MSSLLTNVPLAPRDPILGLNEQFALDTRPGKVNLGVGVYTDEHGKLPLLRCVREAEQTIAANLTPRNYLPIDGLAAYDRAVQALVFGADAQAVGESRIVTVQTLGGTGALKVGADFLQRLAPEAQVLISDPSWENHRALFEAAGFTVGTYPYYDAARRGIDVPAMLAALDAAAPGTVVVLHACCHNPTGYDLTPAQWAHVVEVVQARRLVPFLDLAYQGFGHGLEADRQAVDLFVAAGVPCFVATSFSKSFSLYGERVGALSVVCASKDEATRITSQLKRVVRSNYSNPPTHGAAIVSAVLTTPDLRAAWVTELDGMRDRIRAMRTALVERLAAAGASGDFSFIAAQNGMFSYSGLTAAQMTRLKDDHGIYGVDTGRLCIASLNAGNIDRVAAAIADVTAPHSSPSSVADASNFTAG